MDISIIILNYKSKGFVMSCIKSILDADFEYKNHKLKYEIIVVDNDSNDSIGKFLAWQYPQVIFIQNEVNVGMGAGNNVGMKRARGKYITIMNPDTICYKDTFVKLYNFMELNTEVGIVGPKQLNPDKSVQNSCYRWPSFLTPIYRRTPLGRLRFAQKDLNRYLMKDFDHNSIKEVDWLLGSFLLVNSKAIQKSGFFDERFFMYFEDTDLCKRVWESGWRISYFPEAVIIHNHNRDSAKTEWYNFFTNPSARQHIISWFRYLLKWRFKKSL